MYNSRIVLSVGGSVWYMIRNLRCTVTIDSVLANSKTQNAFLFTVNAFFRQSRLPASSGTWKYAKAPSTKKTWRDSLPIDMLLSAISVLVVAHSSSEIPEGLMNNPVHRLNLTDACDVHTKKNTHTHTHCLQNGHPELIENTTAITENQRRKVLKQ